MRNTPPTSSAETSEGSAMQHFLDRPFNSAEFLPPSTTYEKCLAATVLTGSLILGALDLHHQLSKSGHAADVRPAAVTADDAVQPTASGIDAVKEGRKVYE